MPAGSLTPAPLQTPLSHISPTSRPFASSSAFAAATSATPSAIVPGGNGGEHVVVRLGRHHRERDVRGLVLDPVVVVEVLVPRQAEHLAVEVLRRLDVVHRHADVVDARDLDQGVLPSRYGSYRWWSASPLPSGSLNAAP